MIIHKVIVGPLETNCYIAADEKTKEAIIIDPGDEPEKIFTIINRQNFKPEFILLTHLHFDHIGALDEVKKKFGIDVLSNPRGWTVIKTPGHTKDSVCFVLEEERIIFSGDTLFYRGIGRTDLEGGDYEQIQKSLKRLMEFPDNFKVFPGHGPETTIGEEKANNLFITHLTE